MKNPNQQNSQGQLDFFQSPGTEKKEKKEEIKVSSSSLPKFSVFESPKANTPFQFHSSEEVYKNMKDYQKADREMFLLLFLNAKNTVLSIETHTIGTIDSCAVYPREVFKSAILNNASSIICVHHHPSGDCLPSESDIIITRQLVYAGQLLQIKVLDHIIIGEGRYYSFGDEGIIGDLELESNRLSSLNSLIGKEES